MTPFFQLEIRFGRTVLRHCVWRRLCDGKHVSPTLLELVVAALLLWAAWLIGVALVPRVRAFLISLGRPRDSVSKSKNHPALPDKTNRHGR